MRMYDVIRKKRDGGELSENEIGFFVRGYTRGEIPDYQASALLMAAYLKGLSFAETDALTREIIRSGTTLDLSGIEGIKADKHSTGGVGDGVFGRMPIVAACGVSGYDERSAWPHGRNAG
ncbi:MAG: hypothetical protein ACLRSW_09305 [Christensenellaceae bacterium]